MKSHCCERMNLALTFTCDQHEDIYSCPDSLITYIETFDEYGLIIHDGGSSKITISFCPWCGSKLPESKRDLWFDTLEKLGFDEPFDQNIPEEFSSDAWYRNT